MSTKIYNAYTLPAGSDALVANLAVAEAVRATYRKLALSAVGLTAALLRDDTVATRTERVTTVVDILNGFSSVTLDDVNLALRPYDVEDHRVSNLRLATAIVQAINGGATTTRVIDAVDLQFSVSWMVDPQPNSAGAHDHYAKLFTVRQEYIEAFLAATGATDFHYQDQSDQPEDVTGTEWENRRETWKRVMPDFDPPAAFSPHWELTDVDRLEFATWSQAWLTAQAVCDELEGREALKPESRADFEEWLAQKPAKPESVEAES
ncbi:hypothetical protein [Ornithinimicrobium murale]|uniref:hypothetical protein n=1 Tax=Ornithinimicrobium murale TaxID=1050153 RepID=UPI000E0CD3F3|nr:hypothetical protein [Ornithinimicrobium murale]